MKKLLSLFGFGLLFAPYTLCQPLWELIIDPLNQHCAALSAMYSSQNRLFVSVGERGTFLPSRLFEVNEQGEVLGAGITSMPGKVAIEAGFVGENSNGELLAISLALNPAQPPGDSVRIALFRFNTDLEQLSVVQVGKAGRDMSSHVGFVGPDSTIRLVYQTDDWAGNMHQLEAMKLSMAGDSIMSNQLYDGVTQAPVTSLVMHPNGKMLMGSAYADWGYTPTSGGNVTYIENHLEIDSTYYLEPVDLNNPSPLYNAPQYPIQALPLASGNLLISGQFWRVFGTDQPAVIQRTDAEAHVINQFVADSPWDEDMPAFNKAMDMAEDGTVYFAQMNNWDGSNYFGVYPSQVRLTHLDTALDVLGSYVFDGFMDSTHYGPYSVLTTPDGGILVMGMKRDLNIPNAPTKAWVAKLGPESFTTDIPENKGPVLGLYPNPGTAGFTVELKGRVENGLIHLVDGQGRIVLSQPLNGINAAVRTAALASGLYAVIVRDHAGKVLQSLRWMKE